MESFNTLLGWIGALFSLISLSLAVFFYFRSKKKTRIAFQSDFVSLVGNPVSVFPNEVEISFSGQIVPCISSNTIVIWNCGNQTISGDDLVNKDPLRLEVPDDNRILKYRVLKQTRDVNEWKFDQSDDKILNLTFDYLDPGDGISLEVIHTATGRDLEVTGTVKGMPKGLHNHGEALLIHRRIPKRSNFLKQMNVFLFFILLTGIFLFLYGFLKPQIQEWLPFLFLDQEKIESGQISWEMVFGGLLNIVFPSFLLWSKRRRYPSSLEPMEDIVGSKFDAETFY